MPWAKRTSLPSRIAESPRYRLPLHSYSTGVKLRNRTVLTGYLEVENSVEAYDSAEFIRRRIMQDQVWVITYL
jgi:hypothetical protein